MRYGCGDRGVGQNPGTVVVDPFALHEQIPLGCQPIPWFAKTTDAWAMGILLIRYQTVLISAWESLGILAIESVILNGFNVQALQTDCRFALGANHSNLTRCVC